MEINNIHKTPVPSVRGTSTVNDGDVGQNSPYYRRNRKKRHQDQQKNSEETSPNFDSSSPHIDIRV